MDEKQSVREAFSAIHDEALKLLKIESLSDEVEQGLNLILALSRYQFDVRNAEEKRSAEA